MRSFTVLLLLVPFHLCLSSYALPFPSSKVVLKPRAKYSIVAVDGSSDQSNRPTDAREPTLITTTLVSTHEATETVTATATTPPPSITTVTSTKVIHDEEPGKTVEVVVTKHLPGVASPPQPKAKVAIVSVVEDHPQPPRPHTTTECLPTSTIVSCSTSTPASTSAFPIIFVTISSSTVDSDKASTSYFTPCPQNPSNIPVWQDEKKYASPPEVTPSTSKNYDDGMWHTSYTAWNVTSTTTSSIVPH